MTILYILLFILCLSTLIMVHEAGHLITAKIFKVYCFEYAIGFGPRLISYKRKKGETRFSVRAIPFGGFVSMYGEADAVPEDVTEPIDESRSLNHIAKWKRAIIMTAGIIMNFILAIVIFFIYEIGFPYYQGYYGHITVRENTIAYNAGLRSNDYVYTPALQYDSTFYVFYDDAAVVTYPDNTTTNAYLGFNYSSLTIKDQFIYSHAVAYKATDLGGITATYTTISYDEVLHGDFSGEEETFNGISGFLRAYAGKKVTAEDKTVTYVVRFAITENYLDEVDKAVYGSIIFTEAEVDIYNTFTKFVPTGAYIHLAGDISEVELKSGETRNEFTVYSDGYETTYPDLTQPNLLKDKLGGQIAKSVNFNMNVLDKDTNIGKGTPVNLGDLAIEKGYLPKNLGLSMQLVSYRNNFGQAVKKTFTDFSQSATLIYRGLGSLFTKDGIKNVGGILAIGVYSTQILEQSGFGVFLFYWAMISVNLGIVNLLPFPGLDGWHFLVAIIEGVTRKEINPKFKNIASIVGLILLFSLMILILLKDIFTVF